MRRREGRREKRKCWHVLGFVNGICPQSIQTLQTELFSKKRTSGELGMHPEADVNTEALRQSNCELQINLQIKKTDFLTPGMMTRRNCGSPWKVSSRDRSEGIEVGRIELKMSLTGAESFSTLGVLEREKPRRSGTQLTLKKNKSEKACHARKMSKVRKIIKDENLITMCGF